jgi:hypothetical protein
MTKGQQAILELSHALRDTIGTLSQLAGIAEISASVAPEAHAVLILDQAGWHLSAGPVVPANITLLPLPEKPRAQPGRKRLVVHARHLAVKPHLQIL